MNVRVQGIDITRYHKSRQRKREQTIDGVKLAILDNPLHLVPGVRLWGRLPGRDYRLEPIPGKGQNNRGIRIVHGKKRLMSRTRNWAVVINGRRIDEVLHALQTNPANLITVMAVLRPLRDYVEQSFRFVLQAGQHDPDFYRDL